MYALLLALAAVGADSAAPAAADDGTLSLTNSRRYARSADQAQQSMPGMQMDDMQGMPGMQQNRPAQGMSDMGNMQGMSGMGNMSGMGGMSMNGMTAPDIAMGRMGFMNVM